MGGGVVLSGHGTHRHKNLFLKNHHCRDLVSNVFGFSKISRNRSIGFVSGGSSRGRCRVLVTTKDLSGGRKQTGRNQPNQKEKVLCLLVRKRRWPLHGLGDSRHI